MGDNKHAGHWLLTVMLLLRDGEPFVCSATGYLCYFFNNMCLGIRKYCHVVAVSSCVYYV